MQKLRVYDAYGYGRMTPMAKGALSVRPRAYYVYSYGHIAATTTGVIQYYECAVGWKPTSGHYICNCKK